MTEEQLKGLANITLANIRVISALTVWCASLAEQISPLLREGENAKEMLDAIKQIRDCVDELMSCQPQVRKDLGLD